MRKKVVLNLKRSETQAAATLAGQRQQLWLPKGLWPKLRSSGLKKMRYQAKEATQIQKQEYSKEPCWAEACGRKVIVKRELMTICGITRYPCMQWTESMALQKCQKPPKLHVPGHQQCKHCGKTYFQQEEAKQLGKPKTQLVHFVLIRCMLKRHIKTYAS